MINAIANPTMPEVGERYLGTVVKTTTFGAFVSLLPGEDGLLHISQAARAGRRQAGRQRRGRRQGRRQGAGGDRRDRPARQALADPGRGRQRSAAPATPARGRRRRGLGTAWLVRPPARSHRGDGGGGLVRHTVLPGGLRVVTEAMPTVRSVAVGIWVGVGSRDEAPLARRRLALPRAPAVQGHPAARRAGHLGRDRRGRRRDERVHLQGVHLLLRAGARHRPAARGRRGLRPGHLLGHPGRRRRVRARRDPRRDRHARGRPDRHGPRPVRPGALRRRPAGPAGARHASSRSRRSAAAPIAGYYRRRYRPQDMVVAVAGNVDHATVVRLVRKALRRRRACSTATPRPPRPRRAADRAPASAACASSAGRPSRPTSCSAAPGVAPHRRAPVRARRAQRRARRRHVVAAVPGGPGEARPGLLGLQLPRAVRRHRAVRRLRRLRAAQGRRGARDLPRGAREGRRRTASPPRSSSAARASCAGSLVLGLEDTGSRMSRIGKAELVYGELLSVDEMLGRIDARHPRRGQPRSPPSVLDRAADAGRGRPVRRGPRLHQRRRREPPDDAGRASLGARAGGWAPRPAGGRGRRRPRAGRPASTSARPARRRWPTPAPQVAVDFTRPGRGAWTTCAFCVEHGIHVVVGTSGFDDERLATVRGWLADAPGRRRRWSRRTSRIGAVLMMRFAAQAARFFESVEIVELHHPDKVDAPSGTARRTAELVAAARAAAGLGAAAGRDHDRARRRPRRRRRRRAGALGAAARAGRAPGGAARHRRGRR